jgi:hypothetical protein
MKKRLLTTLVVLTGMFLLTASIVWAQPAPVAKTGQTISHRIGDDGDLEKGVAWPDPRFTDHGDGTVTDKLTGLMWAQDAYSGPITWTDAIDYVNNLSLGTSCGTPLTDWRLPNRNELNSIIDANNYNPALPGGHPFSNVQSNFYWSSTTYADNTDYAWNVSMYNGYVGYSNKTSVNYVWPVRSDN